MLGILERDPQIKRNKKIIKRDRRIGRQIEILHDYNERVKTQGADNASIIDPPTRRDIVLRSAVGFGLASLLVGGSVATGIVETTPDIPYVIYNHEKTIDVFNTLMKAIGK